MHGKNIAQLYENQATHLINEATSADASGSFETVVFPIIRRVFSKLLANDIVSVQAMNLPIGKLFYFVPKISERRSDALNQHWNPVGGAFPNDNTQFSPIDLYDQYYGDQPGGGLFDRSKGAYSAVTSTAVPQAWSTGNTLVDTTFVNVAQAAGATGCTTGGLRGVILAMNNFQSAGAGKLIGPTGNEMDTEEFLGSLEFTSSLDVLCCADTGTTSIVAGTHIPFRVVTQKYGSGIVEYGTTTSTVFPGGSYHDICDSTGHIYIELDLTCPACIDCNSVDGYMGALVVGVSPPEPTFTGHWRVYQDLEFETELAEVSFDLEAVTVSVTERKLRAQWSPELAQDVSAFHNIDAEAELTALLSEEIAAEIDREILRDLRKGASWTLRWDL